MNKVTNILIVGVGGQGTILASKVLGQVAQGLGKEVKVSEIHGMSQRGGSVVTQVRFGEKVYSPVIGVGSADVILAFEKLEALRWLPYLAPDGVIIVNDQEIDPMPVITGAADYPEDIYGALKTVAKTIVVPALEMAKKAGSAKAVNIVLLGVLANILNLAQESWLKAIEELVPPKTIEINKAAFRAGFSFE
ncbi:MAG: indolepyruvate oxidoreductase subunit beta [Zhaonellaceae bacterium]|jgi:indolepyruvate ferredoxin oxidoreductase beta subunit|nr:indolepyruvate oxidoreductase subunit beta [Clostridia bacterium]